MACRETFEIEHAGRKLLIEAECYDSDPSVGFLSNWSEDHCILDPDTHEHRPDLEEQMTDDDWEKIAEKFDDVLNAQPSEFWH